MNDYEKRRQERADRLRVRAARARAESASLHEASRLDDRIPAGQPVLVGHHSEARHRRDLARADARMRRSIDAGEKAEYLEQRAKSVENNTAISSDDPAAIEKLRAKSTKIEDARDLAKRINAAWRRGGADAVEPIAPKVAANLRANGLPPGGRQPIETATISGWSAELRRIQQRINALEAQAMAPEREPLEIGEVTIEESENRVRIMFPGKPSAPVRRALKANGFRWAPSAGAWQRMASARAWDLAKEIVRGAND